MLRNYSKIMMQGTTRSEKFTRAQGTGTQVKNSRQYGGKYSVNPVIASPAKGRRGNLILTLSEYEIASGEIMQKYSQ